MRIEVDRERCDGFGFCEQAAPELVQLDDEGEPEILTDAVPAELAGKAEAATWACPVAALRVVA
jgi:ferredoxin